MAARSSKVVPASPGVGHGLLPAGLLLGFLIYLLAFLSQPSVLGFVDGNGQLLPRFVDVSQILLVEELLAGMAGGGRLEFGISDRLPLLLAAGSWLAIAWWIGLPLVQRALRRTAAGRIERYTLAVLVGLAILSTATLLVGLGGGLGQRWPLLAALALLVGLSYAARRGSRGQSAAELEPAAADAAQADALRDKGRVGKPARAGNAGQPHVQPANMPSMWLARLLPIGVVGLAVLYLLGSLLPPWEFDVVEYHLQAPKEFYQAGQIAFSAHNIYANMPLAAEMHSLAAMVLVGGTEGWWWGGLIGKTIIGVHALLAALLLAGFMARQYGNWSGWAAAGLLLAAPGSAHVALAGLIDMVLAAYLLGGLVSLSLLWPLLRSETQGPATTGILLVSILAGAAAACKYTGLLFAVLPLLLAVGLGLMWSGAGRQFATILRSLTAMFLGLCLTCLPWYAKNWFLSGNPFFPLAYDIFGGRGLSEVQAERWQAAHSVPTNAQGSAYTLGAWWESLTQLLMKSEFLHPSLVFLACCGLLMAGLTGRSGRPHRPPAPWLWAWVAVGSWGLAIWWLATHRIDRFWLPLLPLASGLATYGATWIGVRHSPLVASGMVLLGIIYGAFITASGAIGDNRFFVRLAALRSDSGTAELPGRVSREIAWVNETLAGPQEKLLLIGEAKAYDFRVPILYATCFNEPPGESWLRGKSAAEQRAQLAAHGITQLMINWREIERYRSPGNYGFSDWPQIADIERMIAAEVVRPRPLPWDAPGVQLLQVVPDAGEQPTSPPD